jgi:hypothetical protein
MRLWVGAPALKKKQKKKKIYNKVLGIYDI